MLSIASVGLELQAIARPIVRLDWSLTVDQIKERTQRVIADYKFVEDQVATVPLGEVSL
jgi:hypothetical protein